VRNVESMAERLLIAEHAWLFGLQARNRWGSNFKAERGRRKQTGEEERKVEMR
jgi:hypothetical protein